MTFLLCFILSSSIFGSVCFNIFFKIRLCIRVYSEVRQQCLVSSGLRFSDVSHLDSFFSEFPLIPTIIRINVFLNKMNRSLNTFINH
jgi:hypothetical protein